ncbi:N-formylglutamate amidohydrolase [Novosphingobium chloroacetimidivorans]|uniref:N-formylglutamate amidohydrolase n=1 Tax=Novosphingobium chloroacetimidivorans TaxID=1428314 RepID=A0A7W7K617_9SPHN|nr:N-formylglutamate amidohydrolase [Novosphingobium chloroacetimidivorans]MBB4856900.1 N-formylglutamate amidohydrolase [Novosphingobium chloroacetimidivorans]
MGDEAENESQLAIGGRIPGAPGIAAFRTWGDEPSSLPVVISVPHAGRAYPRALLRDMRHPESSALKLEDRYVDRLARVVAQDTGAALLIAQAPRAMIDLNRAPEDVDWEMFGRAARSEPRPDPANRRARTGLGLIPRRLPGIGELWRRRHEEAELAERITQIHAPYHARLSAMLKTHQERWGAVLLLDLHSMPPLVARVGQPAAEFVIGDRFGTTCHGSLVGAAFSHLAQADRPAAHNRPYAGGYVLERHADVRSGIHAMQVEVDRSAYLDTRMAEPGAGFDDVAKVLTGMVRRLAQSVLELAAASGEQSWPLAAE